MANVTKNIIENEFTFKDHTGIPTFVVPPTTDMVILRDRRHAKIVKAVYEHKRILLNFFRMFQDIYKDDPTVGNITKENTAQTHASLDGEYVRSLFLKKDSRLVELLNESTTPGNRVHLTIVLDNKGIPSYEIAYTTCETCHITVFSKQSGNGRYNTFTKTDLLHVDFNRLLSPDCVRYIDNEHGVIRAVGMYLQDICGIESTIADNPHMIDNKLESLDIVDMGTNTGTPMKIDLTYNDSPFNYSTVNNNQHGPCPQCDIRIGKIHTFIPFKDSNEISTRDNVKTFKKLWSILKCSDLIYVQYEDTKVSPRYYGPMTAINSLVIVPKAMYDKYVADDEFKQIYEYVDLLGGENEDEDLSTERVEIFNSIFQKQHGYDFSKESLTTDPCFAYQHNEKLYDLIEHALMVDVVNNIDQDMDMIKWVLHDAGDDTPLTYTNHKVDINSNAVTTVKVSIGSVSSTVDMSTGRVEVNDKDIGEYTYHIDGFEITVILVYVDDNNYTFSVTASRIIADGIAESRENMIARFKAFIKHFVKQESLTYADIKDIGNIKPSFVKSVIDEGHADDMMYPVQFYHTRPGYVDKACTEVYKDKVLFDQFKDVYDKFANAGVDDEKSPVIARYQYGSVLCVK